VVIGAAATAINYNFGETGIFPQYISARWFLVGIPPIQAMLRETIARAEESAGNVQKANQIRALASAAPILPATAATVNGGNGSSTASPDNSAEAEGAVPISRTSVTDHGSLAAVSSSAASQSQGSAPSHPSPVPAEGEATHTKVVASANKNVLRTTSASVGQRSRRPLAGDTLLQPLVPVPASILQASSPLAAVQRDAEKTHAASEASSVTQPPTVHGPTDDVAGQRIELDAAETDQDVLWDDLFAHVADLMLAEVDDWRATD
jgi:hypothetical protein